MEQCSLKHVLNSEYSNGAEESFGFNKEREKKKKSTLQCTVFQAVYSEEVLGGVITSPHLQ